MKTYLAGRRQEDEELRGDSADDAGRAAEEVTIPEHQRPDTGPHGGVQGATEHQHLERPGETNLQGKIPTAPQKLHTHITVSGEKGIIHTVNVEIFAVY